MTPLQAGDAVEAQLTKIQRETVKPKREVQFVGLCPDNKEIVEIISLAESALKILDKVEFTQ